MSSPASAASPTAETLDRNTLLGFAAAAGLLLLVSLVAILAVRGYGRTAHWVAHTYEVIGELEGLSAAVNAADSARRGFLASGEASYLEERDAALARLKAHLLIVTGLTADNAIQQQRLHELAARLKERAADVDDPIIGTQRTALTAEQRALQARRIHEATADAVGRIDTMEAAERRWLSARLRDDERWSQLLSAAVAVLLLSVAVVLGWLFVSIRREMRDRSRHAAALGSLNLGLEAANRELESFSYSVSHDLRSPLRAIDGFAQMLEEDFGSQLDETGRRYIRTIRGGSRRMAALIDDLLAFSRLSRQNLTLQRVDMTALARRAAAEIVEANPDCRADVRIADLPPAQGDPALLHQVWTNLIGNAVKYSSKSPAPEVRVRARAVGSNIRYEVTDNGVGFDMKYADKLFGVFQRLHALDEYPGTGVGLAIVQRIVMRHAGAVSAHGECDKGAIFGFTLPAPP